MNKRVRAIVDRVRTMRRGPYRPHLYIAKEDGEPSVRMWALSMLIEDRDAGAGGMSYAQFLVSLAPHSSFRIAKVENRSLTHLFFLQNKIRDRVNGGS